MSLTMGFAIGMAIVVFGSAGLAGFAIWIASRDAREREQAVRRVRSGREKPHVKLLLGKGPSQAQR